MVHTYSNKKEGGQKLSAHFKVKEFAQAGNDTVLVDDELVAQLEELYAKLGCSKIVVTSGYRTDSATSQHGKGKAADVNCWHKTGGGEERFQGREILLAAEDVGFRGIGWIPGSAASRAAVHLDTRERAYRFDEANGNRMVKDNSWYAHFGLTKPGAGTSAPDKAPAIAWDYLPDAQIRALQSVLNGKGGKLALDGKAGDATYAAVKKYTIREGDKGPLTKWVQQRLNALGFSCGAADGVAGAKTMAGIAAFQKANGLGVGYLGGADWYYLIK